MINTSGIDEQVEFLSNSVPGLNANQARALLESAQSRNIEVVLGGSRVRSFFGEGTFRPDSDLDIGFNVENLNTNKFKALLNPFEKAGPLKPEKGLRIFTGNETKNVPKIESPQEFFQRSGVRTDPGREGQLFTPSGSITIKPDGTIILDPPRKR